MLKPIKIISVIADTVRMCMALECFSLKMGTSSGKFAVKKPNHFYFFQ